MYMNTVILEIAVDRANEKGVFVAREMLSTLHDTLHNSYTAWWNMIPHASPQFRFFVLHHQGRIRFFIETPIEHRQFLESQLYAHYSEIEITDAVLPFSHDTQISLQKAKLSHIS